MPWTARVPPMPWALPRGSIFDREGRLVASVVQEGMDPEAAAQERVDR